MILLHNAQAGTLESSDVLVIVSPTEKGTGVQLELKSIVEEQFGDQIRRIIEETLSKKDVRDIHITIQDRGALDYSLRARLETALSRACKAE